MIRRTLALFLAAALIGTSTEGWAQVIEAVPSMPIEPLAIGESLTPSEPVGFEATYDADSFLSEQVLSQLEPSGSQETALTPTLSRLRREREMERAAHQLQFEKQTLAEHSDRRALGRIAAAFGRASAPSISIDELPALQAAPESTPPVSNAGSKKRFLSSIVFYKLGLETVGIAVPIAALQATGSASMVAYFMVASGLAQAAAGGAAGGLLQRLPPNKVLSYSMLVQAFAGAALAGTYALLGFYAWLALPLFAAYGFGVGVSETARRYIPPAIVGNERKDLERFNATVHIFYESTAVASAAGAVIALSTFGPWAAIAAAPLAFAVAAFLFGRPLPSGASLARLDPEDAGPRGVKAWLGDLRDGFRALWSHRLFRLALPGVVIPITCHRLLEGFLYPVFAKTVLHSPPGAAWMLGASNLGELIGAVLLIKLGTLGKKESFVWLKRLALATAALWVFVAHAPLALLMAAAALHSVNWAAGDLTLMSLLQSKLPEDRKAQAVGFVFSLHLAVVTALSLAFGAIFDKLGANVGVWAFTGAVTAATLWLAWWTRKKKLDGLDQPTGPKGP